jgi:pyruvate/2-oxoacid:ferredoxin oxidoreductase beta subunit
MGRDVTCVGVAGDGMTCDVGFQSFERGGNIVYICFDNEGYMNTGIQRSGRTPLFGWTTTSPVGEK